MNNNTQQLPSIFNREPDTQYDVLDNLLSSAEADMKGSTCKFVASNELDFLAVGNRIGIADGIDSLPLTHYSLMQACRMAKTDMTTLHRLSQKGRLDLSVDVLQTLFPRGDGEEKTLLIDPHKRVRALNGSDYSRLWDHNVFSLVKNLLLPAGFQPVVTKNGCGALLPAGKTALFRGDQTSFGFFFTRDDREYDEQLGGLRQGIMVWNSEVGARSFGFSIFYFCQKNGTFLMWDKQSEQRKRFVHRGDINRGFSEFRYALRHASNTVTESFQEDMALFNEAANTPFANTHDEALEKLNKLYDMTRGQAEAVMNATKLAINMVGLPLSVWRISMAIAYEAAQTARAEAMVDDGMIASKLIRKATKK